MKDTARASFTMAQILRTKYILLLVNIILAFFTHQSMGFTCHPKCTCIWRKGKQTAECIGAGLEKIPDKLDAGVQVLDLARNNFTLLPRNAFLEVGLVHLQKVFLPKCGIENVDDFALNRISNLIELDLSGNLISYVPTAAFRHLPLLRHLILSGNPLTIIPSQAFLELKTLIILELSNCKIDTIAVRGFEGLEKLEVLKLDTNDLQTLHAKTMIPLQALHGITLDGNPWTCDCELRGLRQWLNVNNVPYLSPICNKPERLRDELWSDVDLKDYACAPIFLNTSSAMNVFEGSNVTFDCRVTGDPIPNIQWIWRERVLTNLSEGISTLQSFQMAEYSDKEKHSRLKVSSVQEPNAGIYTCTADNKAGKVSKNFTLMVSRMPVTGVKIVELEKTQEVKEEEEDKGGSVAGMVIGVVAGAIIAVVILSAVVWACRRRRRARNVQRNRPQPNHKNVNSANGAEPKDSSQEDTEEKIMGNAMNKDSRFGIYEGMPPNELDHYDGVMLDGTVAPPVWMVPDHITHASVNWDVDPNSPQCIIPTQQVLIEKCSRGIPIPMPIPPEDIHVRLHNELSDTLRKKCDRMMSDAERERGDGGCEMEMLDAEGMKINYDPHALAIREEERNMRSNFVPVYIHDKYSDEKGPDLIDHARRDTIPEEDEEEEEEWKNPPQAWMYEQASTHYRPPATPMMNINTGRMLPIEGESTATEV